MSRIYTVSFKNVSVAGAQDLFGILATANMALAIHAIELGQKTLTGVEGKEIEFVRMPAVATVGNGGAAATPRPQVPNDPAATFTARVNDTVGQSTNGTEERVHAAVWMFLNGYYYMWAPEQRPIIKPSQGFVCRLGTLPSAAMLSSGALTVEELF